MPARRSRRRPDAADDPRIVSACYQDITGQLQAALDRLSAEHPHPLLLGCSGLTARAAAGAIRRARNLGKTADPRGAVFLTASITYCDGSCQPGRWLVTGAA